MIPAETTLAFFAVSVLLALSPGPDNIFVLLQSAMRGPMLGLCIVLGLCTGLVVHTTAVAVGLAALFAASALAFTVLKVAGALYLVYLAWAAFRAPVGELGTAEQGLSRRGQLYRRGVIMNLTNPKVSIFFLAFLPQFTVPERGAVGVQVLWLGLLFIVATLLVFGSIAWFAGSIGALLRRSAKAHRALNWISGAIFLGLALRLAADER